MRSAPIASSRKRLLVEGVADTLSGHSRYIVHSWPIRLVQLWLIIFRRMPRRVYEDLQYTVHSSATHVDGWNNGEVKVATQPDLPMLACIDRFLEIALIV